jgi:hypothetical protein
MASQTSEIVDACVLANPLVKEEPQNLILSGFVPPSLSVGSEPAPASTIFVDGLDLHGKIVGKGSCIHVIEDQTDKICLVVVLQISLQLSIHGPTTFLVEGLLLNHIPSGAYTLSSVTSSFVVSSFGTSVIMVSLEEQKMRTSWPDFVVFVDIPSGDPLEFCFQERQSVPSPILSCEENQILFSFSSELLQSLRRLLSTRQKGEKQLFTLNLNAGSSRSAKVVRHFFDCDNVIQKKCVLSGYFSPLSLLLGTNYHFFPDEKNYICSGWGFEGETYCNHFITQVILQFGKNGLKCKAHQVLQNPLSKIFQTK